jgi:hypothetical protein
VTLADPLLVVAAVAVAQLDAWVRKAVSVTSTDELF